VHRTELRIADVVERFSLDNAELGACTLAHRDGTMPKELSFLGLGNGGNPVKVPVVFARDDAWDHCGSMLFPSAFSIPANAPRSIQPGALEAIPARTLRLP